MEPASTFTAAALAAATIIAPHVEVALHWSNQSNRTIGIYNNCPHFVYGSETANTCMAAVKSEPIVQVLPCSHADVTIPLDADLQKDFYKVLSLIAPTNPNYAIELRFRYKKGSVVNSTFLVQYFQKHISAHSSGNTQLGEKELSWDSKKKLVYVIGEIVVENKECMRFSDSVVRIDLDIANKQRLT